ncbi:amidophosphoribosyltransferase [Candidatus Uhrbacteria bacterium RIFCSPLOWO2_02_FULL_48_12]|uniref:Amidophosphoribosyltransferase n=1 Tax=Candidatus Uhrbacteria bacterium RIFCSPLOWO2_02_FULL_48_12 TaxID=1802407 RepID=A0A1F7V5Y9_9BACT|nr:MAG: amidophosphoribosyltransferase [Candidatus Uhrbacteria bacterium RIFCSPLOWO2_02_FULL_48_12]
MLNDDWKEQCGVVGVHGHSEAANLVYLGLYALQHRGQESAGIVASDGNHLVSHRGLGLVADVFDEAIIRRLQGHAAIGHNRYSTSGATLLKNAQPLAVESAEGGVAVAHNGNITNAIQLRRELESIGSIFQSTTDTEVILHLMARAADKVTIGRVVTALKQVQGAYALVFLTEKEMIAARDPHGFRPLVLGSMGQTAIVASETCAFDLIGATYEREIEPGEILLINKGGCQSIHPLPRVTPASCVFEYIYFSRPDSCVYGRNVYLVRRAMGRQLAAEQPAHADLVVPVPDSGVPAALGYAEESKLPFEFGLIRNHYVGRTFIEPEQRIRDFGVKIKLNPQRHILTGKRVAVVDDSIVRGTTCRKLIKMIRDAGAKEVHMRISSPPIIGSCFYGVDTPIRDKLIASNHDVPGIREIIGADSLGYLSLEGLRAVIGENTGASELCAAYFTRRYAVPTTGESNRDGHYKVIDTD